MGTPSRRWRAVALNFCVAASFLQFAPPALAPDTAVSTRELKAAIVLRLIDFVAWPAAEPRTPFRVCVLADKSMADALQRPAQAMRVAGAPVEVQHDMTPRDFSNCRILIIGPYDERKVRTLLARYATLSILTVGESEDFLSAGGVLRIHLESGRVRLMLNMAAAESTRLQISSRLLRLAELVDRPGAPSRRMP